MGPMDSKVASWLPTLVFVPLVGFMLYRRFKRTFGRQVYTPRRMGARLVLLTVVSALIGTSIANAPGFAAAAAGVAVGVTLAVFGLKHTRFEVSDEGKFYVPNPWIGLAVTALFLGRLVARVFTVYLDGVPAQAAPNVSPFAGVQRSPLTLAVFFVMAAYYVVTYAGIIRRVRSLSAR